MRNLFETRVVRNAGIATVATAAACWPRVHLWSARHFPEWYLEAIIALGGFVLWAFVFAWHARYMGRPVFVFNWDLKTITVTTTAGIAAALIWHQFLDPYFKEKIPEDYPHDLANWMALLLFNLSIQPLFLIFAPMAWAARIARNRKFGIIFTMAFVAFVLVLTTQSIPVTLDTGWLVALAVFRMASAAFSIWCYLRGGAVLVWWLIILIHARYLFALQPTP